MNVAALIGIALERFLAAVPLIRDGYTDVQAHAACQPHSVDVHRYTRQDGVTVVAVHLRSGHLAVVHHLPVERVDR